MTKEEKKKKSDEENDILKSKLEEIIKEKEIIESQNSSSDGDLNSDDIEILKQKIIQLEKEKSELTEMAKRAQYDYINLKLDFDRFHRQVEEKNKSGNLDSLIDSVKKFLPFIEDLRKSLDNITEDHLQDPLTKGVQIVYNKFLQTLESMNIKAIDSIGLFPDNLLHEPISTIEVEDKNLKGKIVQEFERGFYYQKDGEKKVITTSKVVIGN